MKAAPRLLWIAHAEQSENISPSELNAIVFDRGWGASKLSVTELMLANTGCEGYLKAWRYLSLSLAKGKTRESLSLPLDCGGIRSAEDISGPFFWFPEVC